VYCPVLVASGGADAGDRCLRLDEAEKWNTLFDDIVRKRARR